MNYRAGCIALVAAVVLLWTGAAGSAAAPFSSGFGVGGTVIAPVDQARVSVADVVALPGGGSIVAANTGRRGVDLAGGRVVLMRFDARGRRVGSFGNHGAAAVALPQGAARVRALVRLADGRLLVAGSIATTGDPSTRSMLVARFDARGKLDPTFADRGVQVTGVPGTYDQATDLAVQHDGAIVLTGSVALDFSTTDRNGAMVLARYLPDGGLDPRFATGGLLTRSGQSTGEFMNGAAVALDDDGDILVGGNRGIALRDTNVPFLARFHTDGSADESVGPLGTVSLPVDAVVAGMALDRARGRVYLAGHTGSDTGRATRFYVAAARMSTLAPISSFGRGGTATTGFPGASRAIATSLAIDAKGRIAAAGVAVKGRGCAFGVARFLRDGHRDRKWASYGRRQVIPGPGCNTPEAIGATPRGLLLAGNTTGKYLLETGPAVLLTRLKG